MQIRFFIYSDGINLGQLLIVSYFGLIVYQCPLNVLLGNKENVYFVVKFLERQNSVIGWS
jgi:hypothetical protein